MGCTAAGNATAPAGAAAGLTSSTRGVKLLVTATDGTLRPFNASHRASEQYVKVYRRAVEGNVLVPKGSVSSYQHRMVLAPL
jgi:hypothetical protein